MAALLLAATGFSWEAKLGGLAAVTLVSALWLRAVGHSCTAPAARLAAALPVIALNACAPLLFPRDKEAVTAAFTAFITGWLSSFKALALAAGRGPLAQQPWSPLQFWVLYALPLIPAEDSSGPPTRRATQRQLADTSQHLLLRWLAKAGVTAAVVFALLLPGLPPFARSCLYILGIYSMLGVVMDGPAALVLRPLALRLAPHFLPPWESKSVAEFWGARWNQAAGNSLRTTIYEPIAERRLVNERHLAALAATSGASAASQPGQQASRRRSARLAAAPGAAGAQQSVSAARGGGNAGGARGAQLAGMAACFLASGVLHEAIFFLVSGGFTRGLSWLWFFLAQAPLILAERWLLAQLKSAGVVLPRAVRRAVTLSVLMCSGHVLFFQPAEAAGIPALFAASIRSSFAELAGLPVRMAAILGLTGGVAM